MKVGAREFHDGMMRAHLFLFFFFLFGHEAVKGDNHSSKLGNFLAKLLCFIILGYEMATLQTHLHCSICLFIGLIGALFCLFVDLFVFYAS